MRFTTSLGEVCNTYGDYLYSRHWRHMRVTVLVDERGWPDPVTGSWITPCDLCGREFSPKDMNVHHTTYEQVGNEDSNDLLALCQECHADVHKLPDFIRQERT